jgi:hypothetical protein
MAAKNFTKTLASGSAEALSSTATFAEYEVFLNTPDTNSGSMTIRNEDDQVLFVLPPGTRDRFKVDKSRMPDPASAVVTEQMGDRAKVSAWDATGTSGDVLYVNCR